MSCYLPRASFICQDHSYRIYVMMLFTSLLAFAIALLSLFSQSLKAYFILDELFIAGELLYVCPNLTQSKL
ncbi:hypothetical protein E1A91_A12G266100v1 [Gossypium mustelinum]|uniref:Uncharacterized protein n=1 Tax=Gossypium mustelinum TaxID=34275 RepID=A0A5D2WZ66_GOSMU|nr:hypothetical protein E1A91_A12G266100v1 [Gossypium mustelinum]TYJ06896.1 hypothetical protein E1A91_A12G266100v1 [Gossypium mustelinum]